MNENDIEALARRMRADKALALHHRSLRNRTVAGGVLLGTALGALWAIAWPMQGPGLLARISIGLVLGAFGAIVLQRHWRGARAACPVCAYDWEIAEGRHVPTQSQLPSWDRCPGCGLPLNEKLLREQLAKRGGTS